VNSILFIIPYFGKWPVWFEAHLLSIAKNPTIDWVFFTDCELPQNVPANVRFVPMAIATFNERVNKVLEVEVPLSARKICDLRPAFGTIFQEYIQDYDFWGFCDVDIIWGNIRKFVTANLLDEYDVISSLEYMVSGHFTLFKNLEKNNFLYQNDPAYKTVFSDPKHFRYDEIGLTEIITALGQAGKIKVFWDEHILRNGIKSEVHQEYFLDRWLFKRGAVYDLFDSNQKEYMYLHFINWKRTMKYCEVKYNDSPEQFYISYNGMHYRPHNAIAMGRNWLANNFNGYYIRLKRKRFRKKSIKLFRRFVSKIS
jgi:hypothetical protein